SEGTSPTYTNTPLIWKVFKYMILIVLLAVFYLCSTYKKKVSYWFWVIYSLIGLVLLVNVLNFIVYREFDMEEVEYCFLFLLLALYWYANSNVLEININFDRLLTTGAIVLFISNAVAIANYYLFGRLPALGYEGGLVRFGGFWDDPNSFGIVSVFFFYYFINKKRYVLTIISLVCIVFTASFTAYFLFVCAIGYWVFITYKRYNKKWLMLGIGIVLSIAAVLYTYWDMIWDVYEIKSESIDQHLQKKMIFNFFPLQNAPMQFSENWYESSFYNYFPFSLIIHLVFLLLLLSLFLNSNLRNYKFFLFLFVVSSFFFSMLYTFPLNFIFMVLLIDYLKPKASHQDDNLPAEAY
ncbi:MAG: hypothetical protein JST19_21345, partial [Bacteroidetes bacterium]|nr:hypothetical protein [Bacteroidota bacterium]